MEMRACSNCGLLFESDAVEEPDPAAELGKIFQESIEKLESIGLSLPPVTNLMYKLKKIGKPVNSGILTVEEAKEEILKMVKKK